MILYVLRYFPTLTETFVHDELRGLAAAGRDVQLAAFDPRGDPGAAPSPVPLHQQPHRWRWLPALPGLLIEWLRRPARASLRVLWLAALLRRGVRRVHVHFAGEAAAWVRLACQRAGVPYSLTLHAVDLFKPHPDLPLLLRDAAAVVTISTYNQQILQERYGVTARLIRCGVELSRFGRGAPADPPVLLAVGRNVPKKGFDILIAAARGLERRAVVRLISDHPPDPAVEVLGLRPRAEVIAALRSATALVLPCRQAKDGDMDGIPVVIIEAMAAGLPVITTAVSGIPELVDDAVGWVVPPDDPEALRAAMQMVLDQPEEAARRGQAGRARLSARGFTLHAQVAAMQEVL